MTDLTLKQFLPDMSLQTKSVDGDNVLSLKTIDCISLGD